MRRGSRNGMSMLPATTTWGSVIRLVRICVTFFSIVMAASWAACFSRMAHGSCSAGTRGLAGRRATGSIWTGWSETTGSCCFRGFGCGTWLPRRCRSRPVAWRTTGRSATAIARFWWNRLWIRVSFMVPATVRRTGLISARPGAARGRRRNGSMFIRWPRTSGRFSCMARHAARRGAVRGGPGWLRTIPSCRSGGISSGH